MLLLQYFENVGAIVIFSISKHHVSLFWLANSFEFHYSKHGEEFIVGQRHLYEDPCDEWLDLVNNRLTSPNFPKAYDPLTDCKWNITAPQGHYVTLDFEIIDVSKK